MQNTNSLFEENIAYTTIFNVNKKIIRNISACTEFVIRGQIIADVV